MNFTVAFVTLIKVCIHMVSVNVSQLSINLFENNKSGVLLVKNKTFRLRRCYTYV